MNCAFGWCRRIFSSPHSLNSSIQRAYQSTFQAGDFCILRNVKSNKKYFVGPLEADAKRDLRGAIVPHSDIIGQSPRAIVRTNIATAAYMAHFPTLDEYVLNVPRACTPIYPKDASTIVELLDLEPDQRILEAGTGNGSLTLYLARAVGLAGRIDTFDVREQHSRAAQKHVERFRRGRYRDTVHFHLGSVGETLSSTLREREEIYDGIVLDMPEPVEELPRVIPYLKNDRFLVCYLPNMTQVLDLLDAVQSLPLAMETCIDTEWKEWEVRPTVIRKRQAEQDTEMQGTKNIGAWVCRPKNFEVRGHTAFLVKLRKCA
ncbi:S-adenosyl-L-methionine-dependent methyltransferase [Radiomyces spectabilis]|uniref:S-adenosyl-L-methionine-dependent methyltransferase n=1 Tax=Radiomyces spectabilis TaxID=64574 RepID=UPI002220AFBA|nr:S-adenosyl-L-methionine-dependent methyltransferase [Radiomyces spectabilis]KAI8370345.1 S-adenosyl-L-methionine-dependent methyltransferase [Radiomyces spectabilis]